MNTDLLDRKSTSFVLWAPGQTTPKLVIGTFQEGAPPSVINRQTLPLTAVTGVSDLFQIAPADCGLTDGTVYHYWFEVDDTRPGHAANARVSVTDPTACTVDWRVTEASGDQPASVIKFSSGKLVACDPDGTPVTAPQDANLRNIAANNFTIIYELPTAWTRQPRGGGAERGVGTFSDIIAMLDPNAQPGNFDGVAAVENA